MMELNDVEFGVEIEFLDNENFEDDTLPFFCDCKDYEYCDCFQYRNTDNLFEQAIVHELNTYTIETVLGSKSSIENWVLGRDTSCGLELTSPILKGEEGLKQLRKVLNILYYNMGCKVDLDCGFHVHINSKNIEGKTMRDIVRRYSLNEHLFDRMVHWSRRESRNDKCLSLDETIEWLYFLDNYHDSAEYFTTFQKTRYSKVNMRSFSKYGTLEFRHHHGSVESNILCPWVQLLMEFFVETVNGVYDMVSHKRFDELIKNKELLAFYIEQVKNYDDPLININIVDDIEDEEIEFQPYPYRELVNA